MRLWQKVFFLMTFCIPSFFYLQAAEPTPQEFLNALNNIGDGVNQVSTDLNSTLSIVKQIPNYANVVIIKADEFIGYVRQVAPFFDKTSVLILVAESVAICVVGGFVYYYGTRSNARSRLWKNAKKLGANFCGCLSRMKGCFCTNRQELLPGSTPSQSDLHQPLKDKTEENLLGHPDV